MASPTPSVRLSLDLDDPQAVPYFLWDEPMTVAELRSRLARRRAFWQFLLGRWRELRLDDRP